MTRPIGSARFVISAAGPRDFPADGLPEIALVGRSNVGKSSLINALLRQDLARTSASPGKTRLVNVYRVAPEQAPAFYLVDLPGFGHAGGGEKARREFADLTAAYFGTTRGDRGRDAAVRATIVGIVLAVDARHVGLASDVEACRWLQSLGVSVVVAAIKVDKLSQSERATLCRRGEQAFGVAPIPLSAISGEGLDEIWALMRRWSRAEPSGGGVRSCKMLDVET